MGMTGNKRELEILEMRSENNRKIGSVMSRIRPIQCNILLQNHSSYITNTQFFKYSLKPKFKPSFIGAARFNVRGSFTRNVETHGEYEPYKGNYGAVRQDLSYKL
jgi:hypothetical protein